MSTHYIPPKGQRAMRVDKIKKSIEAAVEPFITRNKDKKLPEAVDAIFKAIKFNLILPKKPDLGATIMTEAASENKTGKTGPKTL